MKRKMKVQLAIASALGVNAVFGISTSQIAKAQDISEIAEEVGETQQRTLQPRINDRDLTISGGATNSDDMVGATGERVGTIVEQASNWTGNMEVNQGGAGEVLLSDSSTWIGGMDIQNGNGTSVLDHSYWQGSMNTNSTGYGTSMTDITLKNDSLWEGDLAGNHSNYGFYNVDITNSKWQGNLEMGTDGVITSSLSGYVFLKEGSSWTGNAELVNTGSFFGDLSG